MKVDVQVYVDGQVRAVENRLDYEKFQNRCDHWLAGLLKGPEDFIAVRPSKRQGGK